MASAVSWAFSPTIEKRSLRRRMTTSKPVSICRMFSSSGPQRLASRELSTGASEISTGLLFGAGLVFADDNLAPQAVRQCRRDADIDEGIDQPRIADEIHDAVVVGAPGQFMHILLRSALDQHALHAADHRLADDLGLFVDALLQAAEAGRLDFGGRRIVEFQGWCAR